MIFMLIALGSEEHQRVPQCAIDAFTCARRFSGCEVVALSDMDVPPGWRKASPYMTSANTFRRTYLKGTKGPPHRYLPMTMRYYVMLDYIAARGASEPIFNCDWDILVFGNLPEYFQRVGGLSTDLCSSLVRSNGIYSVPLVINNLSAIRAFTDQMDHLLKTVDHNHIFLCDISQWTDVRKKKGYTDSLTASQLGLDCYFDYNMSMDGDLFEMDRRGKKIYWQDGMPYFRLLDGTALRAISMHTFIGWRYNTPDIMANVKPE